MTMRRLLTAAILPRLCALAWAADADPSQVPYAFFPCEMKPVPVIAVMEAVADWQLKRLDVEPNLWSWQRGACFAGCMALIEVSGKPGYEPAMRAVADKCGWQINGTSKKDAHNHALLQTYLELLDRHPDADKLAQLKVEMDQARTLSETDAWWWADALFMSPPAWARLAKLTGDPSYLVFLDRLWAKTTATLYDPDDHLFYRDHTYIPKREANGAKVYWSRGNGWVMAGLARIIPYYPAGHPARTTYETLFKTMAATIISIQHADGTWHASLLAPDAYPLKETSGTGFLVFALAWGINQELLDRTTYEPVVAKGWAALVGCVEADGRLGYVQPRSLGPGKFTAGSSDTFAVGAFLLAGSQVFRLAGGTIPSRESAMRKDATP